MTLHYNVGEFICMPLKISKGVNLHNPYYFLYRSFWKRYGKLYCLNKICFKNEFPNKIFPNVHPCSLSLHERD